MTTASVRDDLAFMKSVVEGSNASPALFGELYMAGGLAYGLQTLGHWGQALGVLNLSPLGGMALAIGPTIAFLAYLGWRLWAHRKTGTGGATSRAIDAVFAAAGMTNIVLAAAIGLLATREGSLAIWMLYPCVVFALQGAAWGVAYALRRRLWQGAVAMGWFTAAVILSLFIGSPTYVLVAALSLLAFMFAPGAFILLSARKAG